MLGTAETDSSSPDCHEEDHFGHHTRSPDRCECSSAKGRETPGAFVNSRLWLTIWISLIVVVVVPWGTFEWHAHWERMEWIPFVSPP